MRDHNNERGERPTFPTCANCGGYPSGIGCYHICYNSIHFYSREQERYDDAQGYYDRYEGWGDPELYPEDDTDYEAMIIPDRPTEAEFASLPILDLSDLPF